MTIPADMAVAVQIAAPAMKDMKDEDPRPCLYLTTLIQLFTWDQSPAQALCSLLAMCWFWPSGCKAEEKNLFLVSVLLSLGRLLKGTLVCLAQEVAACLFCQKEVKGDKQMVTMCADVLLDDVGGFN